MGSPSKISASELPAQWFKTQDVTATCLLFEELFGWQDKFAHHTKITHNKCRTLEQNKTCFHDCPFLGE
eukprot:2249344-Amphidinium_carterae.1